MLMMPLDYDRIFWFCFADIDKIVSERDRHYGLVRPDGSAKPAWYALKRFLRITGDRLDPIAPLSIADPQPAMYHHSWRRADGENLTLFYGKQPGSFRWASRKSVQLHWPATGASETLYPHDGVITVPIKLSLGVLVY